MIESLKTIYTRLVRETELKTHRDLYHSFSLENRLTGIIGPRGVGKTTLMLQYIKNRVKDLDRTFYVSVDHIYFNNNSLLEFVQSLYEDEGVTAVFLDEVHKYGNWQQELKNIYDSFPEIRVVFSSSSSIDLAKGAYDLSRRCVMLRLPGLSFREYLAFKTGQVYPKFTFNDITKKHVSISRELSAIPMLKGHFAHYLKEGYYPFIFEGKAHYYSKINNIIDKTVYSDIVHSFQLKSGNLGNFKKILYFLASIPPGELNVHNLAVNLGVDDKTAAHYIHILSLTGMMTLLFSNSKGGGMLRKPEKMLLDNASLYHAVCHEIDAGANAGTLRELFFIKAIRNSGGKAFYSRHIGDYTCGGYNFEIGGKGKSKKQIEAGLENSFLVKDDILTASRNVIPLYMFGFLG